MIKLSRCTLLFVSILFYPFISNAQLPSDVAVSLLARDNIADVNVDQDKFIAPFNEAVKLMDASFKNVDKNQKIGLLIVSRKSGPALLSLFSNPALSETSKAQFLTAAAKINFANTKLVDFPIMLSINADATDLPAAFPGFAMPKEKVKSEYAAASLKEQYGLTKAWAINEVLPVLAAYEKDVDEKFVGVKNLGALVAATNFSTPQDINKLASTNPDYWRAVLEMNPGNQLVTATKIFMHVAQGEFDIAKRYLNIVLFFSDEKAVANGYLDELYTRLAGFNANLSEAVSKGIALHDKGKYDKAMEQYNAILADYPNSAWAKYELYFSKNADDVKNKGVKYDDRTNWDNAKAGIYRANPLYEMDTHANNGKEAYLLFKRMGISELFKVKSEKQADIAKLADIAFALDVYDFAAQLYWYNFAFSKKNEASLNRFLYCLEQLGVTNLKDNFKGDHAASFKNIAAEKEKEMKESPLYKSFKK